MAFDIVASPEALVILFDKPTVLAVWTVVSTDRNYRGKGKHLLPRNSQALQSTREATPVAPRSNRLATLKIKWGPGTRDDWGWETSNTWVQGFAFRSEGDALMSVQNAEQRTAALFPI
jgi:hypothetical protein